MKRPTHWEQETLFKTGDAYFAGLLQAIHGAQTRIDFETYIFNKSTLGERVVEALVAAARRGVLVKVLVDGWGSPAFASAYWPRLKTAGVRVRFFRVHPWVLTRLPGDPVHIWPRFWVRWKKLNHGTHRKYCLIDENELWVGSFNVSDVHLKEVSGANYWKDIGVAVRGSDIKYAKRAFHRAYRGWSALNWPTRSPRLLLLNDSYLHKRRARVEQIRRMRRAQQRIWLATPYFVPVGSLFRLLARRARAGMDVRLIVPRKIDIWFVKWMSWQLLNSLAKKGVKIFIYTPRFSHQKVFIADEWMCIGSTNLNHRSFLHDLEMDVVITHPENQKTILDAYINDQNDSVPFDSAEWTGLPWWKRWLSSVFLLARYFS